MPAPSTEPLTSELILVNLGTPSAPTPAGVRAFLAEFLNDPMVVDKPRWLWLPILHGIILRRRPQPIAKAYAEIWGPGGSPLAAGTAALSAAVAQAAGPTVRVTHAFRYGSPNLAERLAESLAAHPNSGHPIRVVSLFPQRTASSSETVRVLAAKLAKRLGLAARLEVLDLDPVAPGYITALAEGIEDTKATLPVEPAPHLVGSFHGIPKYVNDKEGERYSDDCRATFKALLAHLEWPRARATLAFQSRFGRDPWIGPATDAVLVELAKSGQTAVLVATPGFLTAGLETIEELGIRGRADFLGAGGQHFVLAPCPVAHDPVAPRPHRGLVAALAELARDITR